MQKKVILGGMKWFKVKRFVQYAVCL